MKKRAITSLVIGMMLVAVMVSSGTVFTQKSAAVTATLPAVQLFHGPRAPLKEGTSTNWAGYAVETSLSSPQSQAVSDVRGQWVVPTVSPSAGNTYSSVWVGIDGYSDSTVEQIGTEQDYINGQPRYYAWYEMYPKPSRLIRYPVAPGDIMSAEVNYIGKNQFVLTLIDQTAGWTFSITQKANAQRQSAEWIIEAPWSGGVLPLANFGTLSFDNTTATLNGHTGSVSDTTWHNDSITMTTSSGTVKARPSALSPDGSSFSVKWYHN